MSPGGEIQCTHHGEIKGVYRECTRCTGAYKPGAACTASVHHQQHSEAEGRIETYNSSQKQTYLESVTVHTDS